HILDKCVFERGMFETELVVRCQKEGIPIRERSADVEEKRSARNFMIKKISQNVYDVIVFAFYMNWEYGWGVPRSQYEN
ncbi:MAG: hypothetical protein ABEJ65_12335, partial [bacterium]